MSIFDRINKLESREKKIMAREEKKSRRNDRRNAILKKYGEGGIVLSQRMKFNRRRLLLLTRLRRK